MKKVLFSIFVLFFSQLYFGQKIFWDENRKLTWDDFQGKENLSGNPRTAAFAYCGIQYQVTRSTNPKAPVSIDVKSSFVIDKSWKRSDTLSLDILKHEQNHFDISEIYVRKIRKFVDEKIKNSGDYDRYFKRGYEKLYAEYRDFQDTYDKETHNSINSEKQKFYNEWVSQQLNELKEYR